MLDHLLFLRVCQVIVMQNQMQSQFNREQWCLLKGRVKGQILWCATEGEHLTFGTECIVLLMI